MSYGLATRSAGGHLVIDSAYRNMFLAERRTVTLTLNAGLNGNLSAFTPVVVNFLNPVQSPLPPMLFLRAISGPVGIAALRGAPGNWTGFEVTSYSLSWPSSTTRTITFEYEYYIQSDDAVLVAQQRGYYSGSAYGVVVRDEAGSLVFDSRLYPMAITDAAGVSTGINPTMVNQYVSTTPRTLYLDQFEGQIIKAFPAARLVDAVTLGSLYGAYASASWPMDASMVKAFLEPSAVGGNQLILRRVQRSYNSTSEGWPTHFGTHQFSQLPCLVIRRHQL